MSRTIGLFEVKSGKLMVTDPCYDRGTWCQGIVENVANGQWVASIEVMDDKQTHGWGERVSKLVARLNGATLIQGVKAEFEVGVDSGQAGIFDEGQYPGSKAEIGEYGDTETFYGRVCDLTHDEKDRSKHAGIIDMDDGPFGVASSSGYGDGGYSATIYRDGAGACIGVMIDFMGEDTLDGDEDEEDAED